MFKAAALAREEDAAQSPLLVPSADFNATVAEVQKRWAALKFLFDVTGKEGCPARSFAQYGEEPLGPVPGDDNARAWCVELLLLPADDGRTDCLSGPTE